MLQEQQHVANAALRAQRDQLFLQAKRVSVGHSAEIEGMNHLLL